MVLCGSLLHYVSKAAEEQTQVNQISHAYSALSAQYRAKM